MALYEEGFHEDNKTNTDDDDENENENEDGSGKVKLSKGKKDDNVQRTKSPTKPEGKK